MASTKVKLGDIKAGKYKGILYKPLKDTWGNDDGIIYILSQSGRIYSVFHVKDDDNFTLDVGDLTKLGFYDVTGSAPSVQQEFDKRFTIIDGHAWPKSTGIQEITTPSGESILIAKHPTNGQYYKANIITKADGKKHIQVTTSSGVYGFDPQGNVLFSDNPHATIDAFGVIDDHGYVKGADGKYSLSTESTSTEETAQDVADAQVEEAAAEQTEKQIIQNLPTANAIWQEYLNATDKNTYRSTLSENDKIVFDTLKKFHDINKKQIRKSLTLSDGTVAASEAEFKTKAKAILDQQQAAWTADQLAKGNQYITNKRLATDYTGAGIQGKDLVGTTHYNMKDERKYGDTYDRLSDYYNDPVNFDWSQVSNKDAYRMRRMSRKSRANGVSMVDPRIFFMQKPDPKAKFEGKAQEYVAPELITTYNGETITGLKQGGVLNYFNLFN